MNHKKMLQERGFNNPVRIRDLRSEQSFYLTPKGELQKVLNIEKEYSNSLFYDIKTLSYMDGKENKLKLSGGVWVDLETDPNNAIKVVDPIKNKCVKALLEFFGSKHWKILDKEGNQLSDSEIYDQFYHIDADGEFKKAMEQGKM